MRDSDQIAWLKRALWRFKDDDGIWKVVFFHNPISGEPDGVHPDCEHEDGCGANNHMADPARARLVRFLTEAGVDLILTGHEHRFHVMSTVQIEPTYISPHPLDRDSGIAPEEHAMHIITGTGGYAHETQPDWPQHVGVPRFFVDGNMMYMVFHNDNDGSHVAWVGPWIWHCLMIKGLSGVSWEADGEENQRILKSECQPLEDFPTWECPESAYEEGSACAHFILSANPVVVFPGRCVRLHSQATDIADGWGPGLRCIPWPIGDTP